MRSRIAIIFSIAATFITTALQSAEAAVAVVVAKASTISSLDLESVRKIFLGKPNVAGLTPVDLSISSTVRQEFLEKVLQKTEKQLSAYWSIQVFTGKGNPPFTVDDGAAAKSWLAKNPNGVAYIDATAIDESVKLVLKVP